LKIGLIITAAGSGTRYSTETLKQLVEVNGRPILLHTLDKFLMVPEISQIVITAPKDCVETYEKLIKSLEGKNQIEVIVGGATRFESVKNGFETLSNVSHVMVHDGVRPNVSNSLICDLIQKSQTHFAVIPGVPISSTVKNVISDRVQNTVDRSSLVEVQTPQLFEYELLARAYGQEVGRSINLTDEACLIENLGIEVVVVEGTKENLKLTVPDDFSYFEYLVLKK